MSDKTDTLVDNPTWKDNIRFFFTTKDIEHMGALGIDLATYAGVSSQAVSIYNQTKPPNASMPPGGPYWSQDKSDTFKNWIANGMPQGTATPVPVPDPPPDGPTSDVRVRRNITSYTAAELETLKEGFRQMMAKDPDDPNSYFQLAGIHWYPSPTYCLHHEDRYNPWHRVYLRSFEDAMRTISGYEDFTLPYWDILDPEIPAVLSEAPLNAYTLQAEASPAYPKGYTTQRYSNDEILQNIQSYDIKGDIDDALGADSWEGFDNPIISAHDSGHVSTGPTMARQSVAAFDPIFWFFHCNWDRLWWKWQQMYQATTLPAFKALVSGSTDWLDTPPFNALPPFADNASQTIDTSNLYYDAPPEAAPVAVPLRVAGSLPAGRGMELAMSQKVSVRLKGVDRLKIPGSFTVHLKAGSKTVAQTGFFQPDDPMTCNSCKKKGTVNFDFIVDQSAIANSDLSVGIKLCHDDLDTGGWFPLTACGNPTLNARLLFKDPT